MDSPPRPDDTSAEQALAVYLRVSSEEQKRQGSIDTWRATCDHYLAVHQLTPVGWYEDEAVSGYAVPFASRPAGARLMADAIAGRVRMVLVPKLDRFGRNAREILNAVHALEQAGVRLVSLKENVDTSTAAGRFFLTVLAGVAELEREMIMERSAAGMERRLTSTAYMGGPAPYGWRVEGKQREARLVIADTPDPESGYSEADVVRLCWHLSVEQDWAVLRIASRLSELGIPTRAGAGVRWEESVVYQILTNTITKGERRYTQNGVTRVETVPGILSPEQWDRAQAALARHKRTLTRSPSLPFLLRDLMRCGLCGAPYTATYCDLRDHKGVKVGIWRHYACHTRLYARLRQRRGEPYVTCRGRAVDADKMEAAVWADVERYIRNPGAALTALAARMDSEQEGAEASRAELSDLERQAAATQAERDRILALYRKGRITERDMDHQMDAMDRESADLGKKRAAVLARLERATAQAARLDGARTLLQRLHARLDGEPLTEDLRRELVAALVVEIRVDTVEAGLSRRGTMKHKVAPLVVYAFDETESQQLGQPQDDSATACRCPP